MWGGESDVRVQCAKHLRMWINLIIETDYNIGDILGLEMFNYPFSWYSGSVQVSECNLPRYRKFFPKICYHVGVAQSAFWWSGWQDWPSGESTCFPPMWPGFYFRTRRHTVEPRFNEPRFNEDPVITNNIWKPGRISVKCMETNPAITNPAITKFPL